MIPKIAEGGASFVGVGVYYLGPGRASEGSAEGGIAAYMMGAGRGEALSGGRVGFSLTRHLSCVDAAQGF